MPFRALLNVRKPDAGLVQVVEAAGSLLGIQRTAEDDEPDAPVYRDVSSSSIFGATLRALARHPTECLHRLRSLDLTTVDDEVAHEVFAKTLQASFAEVGGGYTSSSSASLAPPWGTTVSGTGTRGGPGDQPAIPVNSYFTGSLEDTFDGERLMTKTPSGVPGSNAGVLDQSGELEAGASAYGNIGSTTAKSPTSTVAWNGATNGGGERGAAAAIYALKLAVLEAIRRLAADCDRLPLRNRTTAVLVDGSRMSLLAVELAGAAWKFGRFVVVHVSGEREIDNSDKDGGDTSRGSQERRETDHSRQGKVAEQKHARKGGAQEEMVAAGRWQLNFMQEELREICRQQLGIPDESLKLDFRTLPEGSSGSTALVADVLETVLAEHRVEVLFMGCYGRRGPRVAQFGRVAQWALEKTNLQVVFAKKFSPSMVSSGYLARPKRYLVAVTADLEKVSRMLDRLLPMVSPRDSVVLLHILDESLDDAIAEETEEEQQISSDLASLLSSKRGLSHRVRVEKTGRPPEHATQTVVQRIVRAAEEELADFLAILYDESRGSYRTVATGCLREARCSLVAIHI